MANSGFSVSLTPTVGTAGYIAGDGIGGILDFGVISGLSGETFVIDAITFVDASKSHWAGFIEFFSATPSGGTYTDSSPLVYAAGDLALSQGIMASIAAADWVDLPRVSAVKSEITYAALQSSTFCAGSHLFALLHSDSTFSLTNGNLIIKLQLREA